MKAEEPEMYETMKKEGKLNDHLSRRAEQARRTYEGLVNRRLERYPNEGAFAHQSAEEIVIRGVLRYQT